MTDTTNAAPQPAAVAGPTRAQIRDVFLANGFTVKEGHTDLKDYVYDAAYALLALVAAPIDMVLHCPKCGMQHIDAPSHCTVHDCHLYGVCYAEASGRPDQCNRWDNPPHRSHLCHGCGHIWRPADVPTNGVQAVKTTGKADSPVVELDGGVKSFRSYGEVKAYSRGYYAGKKSALAAQPVGQAPWFVGDRVACSFHHDIPATITRAHESGGFDYVLDERHDLGPRHGYITEGTAHVRDGWHRLPPSTPVALAKLSCALGYKPGQGVVAYGDETVEAALVREAAERLTALQPVVRKPLTSDAIARAFCEIAKSNDWSVHIVKPFTAGVRFAERAQGISEGE